MNKKMMIVLALIIVISLLMGALPAFGSAVGSTTQVSVNSNRDQADNISGWPSTSEDGRFIVFDSIATNLDVNFHDPGGQQVYLHDRDTGTTRLISKAVDGGGGNDSSGYPRISSCGSVIVFQSRATNLTDDILDTTNRHRIFYHRVDGGTTYVIPGLDVANNNSSNPSVSKNGYFIAFRSRATNLVPGGTTPGILHVYVWDEDQAEMKLITTQWESSDEADGSSDSPSISDDGRWVAFSSDAKNLLAHELPSDSPRQIYRKNHLTDAIELISKEYSRPVRLGDDDSYSPAISADGSVVAFSSHATNIGGGDSGGWQHVYVWENSQVSRVSISTQGITGNDDSYSPSISAYGRYISFSSVADNLVADGQSLRDVYLHDRYTHQTHLVSVGFDGGSANGPSEAHNTISLNGQFIAFSSSATNLIENGTNGEMHVFVREKMIEEDTGTAPQITSPASTTFAVGAAGSFTVTTTGIPTPSLANSGTLPGDVDFTDNGDGTASLSGTPAAGSEGEYSLTITASNSISPNAIQSYTLTVVEAAAAQAPQITSPASTTFAVGAAGSFTVRTTGIPTPSLANSGTLPGGVTFTDNGDGTASLSGTPADGSEGEYSLTITASNGVGPNATQQFILKVSEDAGSKIFLPMILR